MACQHVGTPGVATTLNLCVHLRKGPHPGFLATRPRPHAHGHEHGLVDHEALLEYK